MKFERFRNRVLVMLTALLLPLQSHGVIIAGAKGGADNTLNTTRDELNALTSQSDGYYFDNVFQFGAGAGAAVYIGFANTVDGPRATPLPGCTSGTKAASASGPSVMKP